MRLLIVDDEMLIAQGIRHIVQKLNTEFDQIEVAFSGKEALEKLRLKNFDFMITDVAMPGMDGLELIQRTKRAGLCGHFCILSGYSEFDYAREAVELGVLQYLLKPVDKEKLKELLDKCSEEIQTKRESDRRLVEIELGEVLFEGETNLPKEVIGETGIAFMNGSPKISKKELDSFLYHGLAKYILHIPHTSYLLALTDPGKVAQFAETVTESFKDVTVGFSRGEIKSGEEMRILYERALQGAFYSQYVLGRSVVDAEELLPFPYLGSFHFSQEIKGRYGKEISERDAVQLQTLLQSLLGNKKSANPYVREMQELIHAGFQKDLDLSSTAAKIGLNTEYAGRLFKNEIGCGFQEYLNQYRITRMLELMQADTGLSFEQLAPCMGFPDVRNFYRVFKRVMKMTPGEYKKILAKKQENAASGKS